MAEAIAMPQIRISRKVGCRAVRQPLYVMCVLMTDRCKVRIVDSYDEDPDGIKSRRAPWHESEAVQSCESRIEIATATANDHRSINQWSLPTSID